MNRAPKIDSDIGIRIYSTNFEGCDGKIKENYEDFVVSEILDDKAYSKIIPEGNYAVYKLKKHHIDTYHALNKIFKKHGLRLKSLGLKDARAVTEQFVCSQNKAKFIEKLNENKYSLQKIGFVNKPFSKKDMIGNRFQIKINNAKSNISKFDEYDKILNFYGYQRFGSKRPINHLVGKALVQRKWDDAVDLFLSYTSSYDSAENIELRKKLSEKANLSKILNKIPPQWDLEQILVSKLIQDDNPFIAIRALPILIRRFFVQAYQSFIFNQTLSKAYGDGEDLLRPQEGDVCYNKDGSLTKFDGYHKQNLAVPYVGYSYYKKTRFDYQISNILASEEISAKDFFVKEMQEISNEGGFRQSVIKCANWNVCGNTISFTLSRGSYATIVLRELIKPIDPILAGLAN